MDSVLQNLQVMLQATEPTFSGIKDLLRFIWSCGGCLEKNRAWAAAEISTFHASGPKVFLVIRNILRRAESKVLLISALVSHAASEFPSAVI